MPIWTGTLTLTADRLPWAGRWPRQATAEALTEAQGLVAPQAVYELVTAEPTPAGPRLPDGPVLHSPRLAAALGPAGRLLLSICTIGPALEARCQEWSAGGDLTRAFLLDALGVVALQDLGTQLERHIAHQLAPEGLRLGCPLAPGQDDWPLEDQRTLFALLQPDRIGIQLNENCLMVPLKSASTGFPVGREGELPTGELACARCERRESCPYAQ
jgi:hypothetical protein